MKNVNEAQTIADTLDKLAIQRETWEQGAYKKSNEELYKLLDNCLNFYFDLKGNTSKCKALNAQLKARELTFNEGAT